MSSRDQSDGLPAFSSTSYTLNRRRLLFSCATGEYQDNSTCVSCTVFGRLCKECNMLSCTKCTTGFLYDNNGTAYCIPNCPTGANASNCPNCGVGKMLAFSNTTQAMCVNLCGSKEYFDSKAWKCFACPGGCLACSMDPRSVIRCTICSDGYVLTNGDKQCHYQDSSPICGDRCMDEMTAGCSAPSSLIMAPFTKSCPDKFGWLQTYDPLPLTKALRLKPLTKIDSESLVACSKGTVLMFGECLEGPDLSLFLEYGFKGKCADNPYLTCNGYTNTIEPSLIPQRYFKLLKMSIASCDPGHIFANQSGCVKPIRSDEVILGSSTDKNCLLYQNDGNTLKCSKCAAYSIFKPSDPDSPQCIACPNDCMQCENGDCKDCPTPHCVTCNKNEMIAEDGKCVPECPLGAYFNFMTGGCSLCHPDCNTCSGPGEKDCIKYNRFETSSGLAAMSCKDFEEDDCNALYENGCEKCLKLGKSGTPSCVCVEPKEGFNIYYLSYPMPLIKACGPSNFYNRDVDECLKCHSACQECRGPQESDCTVCSEDYAMYNNRCFKVNDLVECRVFDGWHNTGSACKRCSDTRCLICESGPDFCSYCAVGSHPDANGKCVDNLKYVVATLQYEPYTAISCEPGYTIQSGCQYTFQSSGYREKTYYQSARCSSDCWECDSDGACTSCAAGNFLAWDSKCFLSSSTAIGPYYLDATKIVQMCEWPCKTCSSDGTRCGSCRDGYYLYQTDCMLCSGKCRTCDGDGSKCTSCHIGFMWDKNSMTCMQVCQSYEYYDKPKATCFPCNPGCATCEADSVTCTSCPEGMFLKSGICIFCHDTCATCVDTKAGNCLTCKPFYEFDGGYCVKRCPGQSFSDTSSRHLSCRGCHTSCAECAGPSANECTKCYENYRFEKQKPVFDSPNTLGACIIARCDPGYYPRSPYPNFCMPCHAYCLNCNGPSAEECTLCKPGHFLRGNQCFRCHPNCKECTGWGKDSCVDCDPSEVWSEKYGKCISKCRSVGFSSNDNTGCKPCHPDCLSCEGGSTTTCTICASSERFLLGPDSVCVDRCPTGSFYNSNGGRCEYCSSLCDYCLDALPTSCSQCASGSYQMPNKTCVASCPVTYFANNVSRTCESCALGCSNCTASTPASCTQCALGNLKMPNNSCVASCPLTFYNSSSTCLSCAPLCDVCTSNSTLDCSQCSMGIALKLPNNSCVSTCPLMFFNSSTSCLPCASLCGRCTSASPSDCTQCIAGNFKLPNNSCVAACPSTFFAALPNCLPCALHCDVCTSTAASACTQCSAGSFKLANNTCVISCPLGFFPNTNTSTCDSCATGCDMCTSGLPTSCTQCSVSTYKLPNNTCVSTCPLSFYANASTCLPCAFLCDQCTGSAPALCTQCSPSAYRLANNSCAFTCPLASFPNTNTSTCDSCAPLCDSCTGSAASLCDQCAAGTSRLANGTCSAACPLATYLNSTTNSCLPCPPLCDVCTNSSAATCSQCSSPNLKLPNSSCVATCPPTFFASSGICVSCAPLCDTCTDSSAGGCSQCSAGKYKLANGSCVGTCPAGYFGSAGSCLGCAPLCDICTGYSADMCDQCAVGTIQLPNGTCSSSCPNAMFMNSSTGSCENCAPFCDVCSNSAATSCSQCMAGKYRLPNNTCISTCPLSFYANASTCLPCAFLCDRCTGSAPALCTQCSPSAYRLANNSCAFTCPLASFPNTNTSTCDSCAPLCDSCTGSAASLCDQCAAGASQLPNGTCSAACPLATYLNSTTNSCLPCPPLCDVCTNSSAATCSQCSSPNLKLPNSSCVATCPPTFFASSGICVSCAPLCDTCTDSSAGGCSQCSAGKYKLANGSCVGTCPAGYFGSAGSCLGCAPLCDICTSANDSDCTQCKIGNFKMPNNTCLAGCPPTYYSNLTSGTCKPCGALCNHCDSNSPTTCIQCNVGSYKMPNNSCVQNCPLTYYANNSTNTCTSCAPLCDQCFNSLATSCVQCSGGAFKQQDSSCAGGCSKGTYFSSSTNRCEFCAKFCEVCTDGNPTSCTKCVSGAYRLPDSTCGSCPTGYYGEKTSTTCELCSSECLTCTGPQISQCTSCSSTRKLDTLGYCGLVCLSGQYYYAPSRQCLTCHPDCVECVAGSQLDCTICAGSKFKGPDKICTDTCPLGTFQLGMECISCHATCDSCTGPLLNQCVTCKTGLKLLKSGACSTSCDPRQFVLNESLCSDCHSSCQTCSGGAETDCIECGTLPTVFRTPLGKCIDCMADWAQDTDTCWFVVSPSLAVSTQASMNVKASTTARITFPHEGKFLDKLSLEALKMALKIEVTSECESNPQLLYEIRNKELLVDISFSVPCSIPAKITLKVLPLIMLKNSKTGKSDLIYAQSTSNISVAVSVAPSGGTIEALMGASSTMNSVGASISTATNVMAVGMVVFSSGAGGALVKMARVLKSVSRLRLANAYFGPYLEIALSTVGKMFPLGDDTKTKEWILAASDSRHKLDFYEVTVLSVETATIAYVAYFCVFAARFYRSKIRVYSLRKTRLIGIDNIIDSLAEQGRVMVMTVFGIDAFFYSIRTLSHASSTLEESYTVTRTISKTLSYVAVLLIVVDLMRLFEDNQKSQFAALRLTWRKNHRAEVLMSQKTGGSQVEPLKKTKTNNINEYPGIIRSETKGQLITPGQKKLKDKTKSLASKNVQVLKTKDLLPDHLKNYIISDKSLSGTLADPSLEQFFGNGIKLNKLRTTEGRYFNNMAMLKMFAFEPIYVTLQTLGGMQLFCLLSLQVLFLLYLCRCGFLKSIFTSKASFASMLFTEVTVCLLMILGMMFRIVDSSQLNQKLTDYVQFAMIGLLTLSTLAGMVEFAVSIVLSIKKALHLRKLKRFKEGLELEKLNNEDVKDAEAQGGDSSIQAINSNKAVPERNLLDETNNITKPIRPMTPNAEDLSMPPSEPGTARRDNKATLSKRKIGTIANLSRKQIFS